MAGPTFTKDPDGELFYEFNWATEDSYLNDGSDSDTGWLQGETIAASSVTVEDGITLDSTSFTDVRVLVKLTGGTAGVDYTVKNQITTSKPEKPVRRIIVRVLPK